VRPYKDLEITDQSVIREFDENIDPIELLWHRDDEGRLITILEVGPGWKFQLDEQLPEELEPKMRIFIPRHQWHRVIKGEGKLLISIEKIDGQD
jgi:quercetin dioxygenase-like cupin family protein